MLSYIFVLFPFLVGVSAANDWSVPCINGVCQYDLPGNASAASGSLKIWGSTDAITDITTAADWQILDCNSTALAQDIRLVCMNDPAQPDSKCGHLYQNIGAVNKIVRLPENCGASAFARVAKAWVPEDQSIPAHVQARLVRRAGAQPVVKALHIDTDFDAADWSKTGMVNIAIQGANVPGTPTDVVTPGSRARRASRRGLGDFLHGAIDFANKTIDVNKNFDLPPLTFDKSVNLLDSSVSCLGESLSLSVDMEGSANMQAILSVAALGTIIPPKITQFSISAVMSGTVGGTLQMTADATGSITSGKVPLVNIGIPGLDFPGILTIGPSFQVDALVEGEVDVTMDMTLGVSLDLSNATVAFPPASGSGGAPDESAFTLGDTPVTLNAAADVQATGTITAHVIPSLNLGVSALGGKGEASIFLALDASAAMTMNLDGTTDDTATTDTDDDSTDDGTDDSTDDGTSDTTPASTLGGCINVAGNINVNVGADGSFFGTFISPALSHH
ncbi:hypothetical protein GGX14DRAFT_375706 [Mycena pura]|uniref:DUF7223 domain-containing protein n=1 Tax=Mycena pura TaxID=153505 RepID=A0AAD6Y1P3_9AGAR|nr:hypothetical protein GGX14DRAFT_375706 [Mycena pura]